MYIGSVGYTYDLQRHGDDFWLTVEEVTPWGSKTANYQVTEVPRRYVWEPRAYRNGPFTFFLDAPWDPRALRAKVHDDRPNVRLRTDWALCVRVL